MKKSQRKQAYATNSLLEHAQTYPVTNIVKPSEEAVTQAKEFVDNNPK